MVRESRLHPDDLIAPLFVNERAEAPIPISSLPGQVQHTRESLRQEVRELKDLGVPAVVLFGLPEHKDPEGSEAWNPDGVVQVAIKDLKDDPFRSLAGEMRRAGGFAKDTTPFSEFLWADFLRRHIPRKTVENNFAKALEKGLALGRGKDAVYLPGWCGPASDD